MIVLIYMTDTNNCCIWLKSNWIYKKGRHSFKKIPCTNQLLIYEVKSKNERCINTNPIWFWIFGNIFQSILSSRISNAEKIWYIYLLSFPSCVYCQNVISHLVFNQFLIPHKFAMLWVMTIVDCRPNVLNFWKIQNPIGIFRLKYSNSFNSMNTSILLGRILQIRIGLVISDGLSIQYDGDKLKRVPVLSESMSFFA